MIKIFKAIGDETRLRILNLLLQSPLCVCEIEYLLKISQSNASRHLFRLQAAEVITSEKRAQWVYYGISEAFKREHRGLYEYLLTILTDNPGYERDNASLAEYKASGKSCTLLKNKK